MFHEDVAFLDQQEMLQNTVRVFKKLFAKQNVQTNLWKRAKCGSEVFKPGLCPIIILQRKLEPSPRKPESLRHRNNARLPQNLLMVD